MSDEYDDYEDRIEEPFYEEEPRIEPPNVLLPPPIPTPPPVILMRPRFDENSPFPFSSPCSPTCSHWSLVDSKDFVVQPSASDYLYDDEMHLGTAFVGPPMQSPIGSPQFIHPPESHTYHSASNVAHQDREPSGLEVILPRIPGVINVPTAMATPPRWGDNEQPVPIFTSHPYSPSHDVFEEHEPSQLILVQSHPGRRVLEHPAPPPSRNSLDAAYPQCAPPSYNIGADRRQLGSAITPVTMRSQIMAYGPRGVSFEPPFNAQLRRSAPIAEQITGLQTVMRVVWRYHLAWLRGAVPTPVLTTPPGRNVFDPPFTLPFRFTAEDLRTRVGANDFLELLRRLHAALILGTMPLPEGFIPIIRAAQAQRIFNPPQPQPPRFPSQNTAPPFMSGERVRPTMAQPQGPPPRMWAARGRRRFEPTTPNSPNWGCFPSGPPEKRGRFDPEPPPPAN